MRITMSQVITKSLKGLTPYGHGWRTELNNVRIDGINFVRTPLDCVPIKSQTSKLIENIPGTNTLFTFT
jgi:hypothetical protein